MAFSRKALYGHCFQILYPPRSRLRALPAALLVALAALPLAGYAGNSGGYSPPGYGSWYVGDEGASNNTDVFYDGIPTTYIYVVGGYSDDSVNSADEVKGNVLTIDDTANSFIDAYGGYARDNGNATATRNTVTINGGMIDVVSGGYSYTETSGGAVSAENNEVIINDGSFFSPSVCGGCAKTESAESASATGNIVTINGGNFAALHAVFRGGYAHSESGEVSATDNTVTLRGGSFSDMGDNSVYGGYAFNSSSADATVTNNTVVLGRELEANTLIYVALYGGYVGKYGTNGTGTENVSGNTLEVQGKGLKAKSIKNFDNYVFAASALSAVPALTLKRQYDALDRRYQGEHRHQHPDHEGWRCGHAA